MAPDPLGSRHLRLGAVGRLDREKNPARSIAIFAALHHRRPDALYSLWFAGAGSDAELANLRCVTEELGVAHLVQFLGVRNDVQTLLTSTDLLLSPTLREGLPGAIIEAAAAGIPAVVSAIAPCEEVARCLPSVFTMPIAASDDEWCEVIEDVLADTSHRLSSRSIRRAFDRSPFALTDDQHELDALWS